MLLHFLLFLLPSTLVFFETLALIPVNMVLFHILAFDICYRRTPSLPVAVEVFYQIFVSSVVLLWMLEILSPIVVVERPIYVVLDSFCNSKSMTVEPVEFDIAIFVLLLLSFWVV